MAPSRRGNRGKRNRTEVTVIDLHWHRARRRLGRLIVIVEELAHTCNHLLISPTRSMAAGWSRTVLRTESRVMVRLSSDRRSPLTSFPWARAGERPRSLSVRSFARNLLVSFLVSGEGCSPLPSGLSWPSRFRSRSSGPPWAALGRLRSEPTTSSFRSLAGCGRQPCDDRISRSHHCHLSPAARERGGRNRPTPRNRSGLSPVRKLGQQHRTTCSRAGLRPPGGRICEGCSSRLQRSTAEKRRGDRDVISGRIRRSLEESSYRRNQMTRVIFDWRARVTVPTTGDLDYEWNVTKVLTTELRQMRRSSG